MNKCLIFAGGEEVSTSCLTPEQISNSYVISADRGYMLANKFGVKSDLIVGDFDSLGGVPNVDTEIITFPVEKDDTDLMLAVKEGLKRGCDTFTILGAMGGRFDHTIGNIQTLAFLLNNNAVGTIISDHNIITLVNAGHYTIDFKENYTLSLASYSEKVSGICMSGVQYPLKNATIDNGFPLGISNHITSSKAEISFTKGQLLIIQSDLLTKI